MNTSIQTEKHNDTFIKSSELQILTTDYEISLVDQLIKIKWDQIKPNLHEEGGGDYKAHRQHEDGKSWVPRIWDRA